jgi:chaperonin GroEL
MPKQILYDIEAKKKLVSGITKLTEVVRITMGPKGRHVAIDNNFHSPHVTRDGVTVAKAIELPDHMENMGAQLVKEVASRTAEAVGDGTTTATVLARSIFCRSLKYITAGADDRDVKRGVEAGMQAVVSALKKLSKPVNTPAQIRQVATLSSNQDEEIGKLISNAFERLGKDGIITVEEANGTTSTLTFAEGAKIDTGYLSHHFITNVEKSTIELENPLILVTDHKINVLAEILPLLEKIVDLGKMLLIIADTVENEALTALVLNHKQGVLRTAAIKSPGFGEQKRATLEDLALLTGATFISQAEGHRLNKILVEHLGSAKKVIIEKEATTIIEGTGNKTDQEKKIRDLKHQMKNTDEHEHEKIEKRIALLTGGVAQINLAAHTESEMREKRDRTDDAIQATRAAMEEGVVVGGGVAFLRCAEVLDNLPAGSQDEKVGHKILKLALQEPAFVIAQNANAEASVVIEKILKGKDDFGYNAATGQYELLMKSGIVDPLKVVRLALEHAVSVAGMMLTTYCMVAEEQEEAIANGSDQVGL